MFIVMPILASWYLTGNIRANSYRQSKQSRSDTSRARTCLGIQELQFIYIFHWSLSTNPPHSDVLDHCVYILPQWLGKHVHLFNRPLNSLLPLFCFPLLSFFFFFLFGCMVSCNLWTSLVIITSMTKFVLAPHCVTGCHFLQCWRHASMKLGLSDLLLTCLCHDYEMEVTLLWG